METGWLSESWISDPAAEIDEAIRRRAEEIYIQSGRIPGHDVENWTRAEREVLELASRANRCPAIVVKVNGSRYVGEYLPKRSDGYVPGEISAGSSVLVRFDGDKMFIKRSNGKELETRIVRKTS